MKKIYLFAPLQNQYGVIDYFTKELSESLKRQGIITKIITAKRDDPRSFLDEILTDPPDCTLSFNGLLPDEHGRFLSDLIDIPHIAYLTDAPTHYFSLVRSRNTIITVIDQDFAKIFKNMNFNRVLFVPHGVSKDVTPLEKKEYIYDVLMLNTFIDFEEEYKQWPDRYGKEMTSILRDAAEITLGSSDLPFVEAFVESMNNHIKVGRSVDLRKFDYSSVLESLEMYVGGKSRVELLQAIDDVKVDLFGRVKGTEGWAKYLKHKKNITIHDAIPFKQALECMQQAKIILNCTPEIKRGLHERILSGMASGAAAMALETPYLRECFKDGEDILLYGPRQWKDLNENLHYYLSNDKVRFDLAAKGSQKVLREHTWDQRAKCLIAQLESSD